MLSLNCVFRRRFKSIKNLKTIQKNIISLIITYSEMCKCSITKKKKEPCRNNHLAINLTFFRRYMYCFRSVCYSNATTKKKVVLIERRMNANIYRFSFFGCRTSFLSTVGFRLLCARPWRFITKTIFKEYINLFNIFGMKL